MKKRTGITLSTIVLLSGWAVSTFAQAALEERVAELEAKLSAIDASTTLHGIWDSHGPRLETNDKRFSIGIHGRLQLDSGFFIDPDESLEAKTGDLNEGLTWRRVRPRINVTMYDRIHVQVQYDFAHAHDPHLKDTYMQVSDIPFAGNLTMGNFKEPFGLDEITSSKYLTFLERNMGNALQPQRNMGIMLNNTAFKKRMTWAIGGFQTSDADHEDESDGDYDITARATALPWYHEGGKQLIHVGIAGMHRNDQDHTMQIAARPGTVIAPAFVNTGDITVDEVQAWGAEAAVVWNRFSVQGEYIISALDSPTLEDPEFSSWYAMGSVFVTDDHRRYKTGDGSFVAIHPKKSFPEGGGGALELVARYDTIDLNDGEVTGGELETITSGLNWYLNGNSKMMIHLVHADLQDTGAVDMLTTRFQVNF